MWRGCCDVLWAARVQSATQQGGVPKAARRARSPGRMQEARLPAQPWDEGWIVRWTLVVLG